MLAWIIYLFILLILVLHVMLENAFNWCSFNHMHLVYEVKKKIPHASI